MNRRMSAERGDADLDLKPSLPRSSLRVQALAATLRAVQGSRRAGKGIPIESTLNFCCGLEVLDEVSTPK